MLAKPSRDWGVPLNPERRFLLEHIHFDKMIVRAEGHYLYDESGKSYLDGLAQYGALPFGHNPSFIWDRVLQVRSRSEPTFVQPLLCRHAEDLANKLVGLLPQTMRYVTYVNSGAEATEAAIKMVRAKTHRPLIVSFQGGFHGKTTGALMCTGNPAYREPFLIEYPGHTVLPFGDLDGLRELLGTGTVAGVFVESVQGEGGMRSQPQGFLSELTRLCREHESLLVIDEVQSGLGRSGHMFAFQAEPGAEPDILLLAKALGGGLLPMGALVCNERSWTGAFGALHSSTFANGNLAASVACAVIDELLRDDSQVIRHVQMVGERLRSGLQALCERYPENMAATNGRGLMQGLRILPWSGEHSYFSAHASQLGYAVPIVAGYLLNKESVLTAPVFNQNNVLRIQPSLTITAAEIDRILAALDVVGDLLSQRRHGDLFAYMAEPAGDARRAVVSLPAVPKSAPAPAHATPDAGRRRGSFAFLIHPTDEQVLLETLPEELVRLESLGAGGWQDWMRTWFTKMHEPAAVYHQAVVPSDEGGHAEGWLIASPLMPSQMLRLPKKRRELLLQQYLDVARGLGVDIVGLGAFTSVISRCGMDIADQGLNLTTGNSYTALASNETLIRAVHHRGLDPGKLRAAVIGAAGSVGRLAAIDLGSHFGALDLVGNAANPEAMSTLEEVGGEIYAHVLASVLEGRPTGLAAAIPESLARRLSTLTDAVFRMAPTERAFLYRLLFQQVQDALGKDAPLRTEVDVRGVLAQADAVLTATSASRSFIDPAWLPADTIVCDVARPLDVLAHVRASRPEVWVYEGGVVQLPAPISFGRQNVLGYPRGLNLACLSETITLAMEGASRHYSLGSRIDITEARHIHSRAKAHGFRPYLDTNTEAARPRAQTPPALRAALSI